MKRVLLFITILCCVNSFSQNLSIDELLKLKEGNVGIVDEFLTGNGWSFLEAKEPEQFSFGIVTFAYKKGRYDDSAESFLKFIYSENLDTKRVSIQVNNNITYNNYLSRIKALGYKLISSKVKNGNIIKVYTGPKNTFQILTSTVDSKFDSKDTVHHFLICDNKDYEINFIED